MFEREVIFHGERQKAQGSQGKAVVLRQGSAKADKCQKAALPIFERRQLCRELIRQQQGAPRQWMAVKVLLPVLRAAAT